MNLSIFKSIVIWMLPFCEKHKRPIDILYRLSRAAFIGMFIGYFCIILLGGNL